jgi:cytochrome P450
VLERATQRAKLRAAELFEAIPSAPRPLSAPPAGSGLRPVPGDRGPPLIGYSLSLLTDVLRHARRRYERYGPVSWSGGVDRPVVSILGPDAIEEVLADREHAISNRGGWGYLIGPFFRGAVMLMDGDEHRHHRRIMQEAFRRERLDAYLRVLHVAIERGVDGWAAGERFRAYDAVKQLTLDIGTEVFVGAALGTDRLDRAFVDAVHGGRAVVRADIPGGAWHRGLAGRRLLEDSFRGLLPVKRAGGGVDLFSVLARAESDGGERFSDEDVIAHMIFVLMAAHDTSTNTIAMMIYLLARHPEWQQRLRAESRALGVARPDMDGLERLTSLDHVMRETLRMYAPVGILFRETTADVGIQGFHVPAGTLLAVGLYATMRMEPWWHDPDRFDPERFADDRREDLSHRYAWVPFGGHAHKCIGLHFGGIEVKALMHRLLLRFQWSVPAGYEPPLAYGTGPNPADGLPVALRHARP